MNKSKTAIITGATSGIGTIFTRTLAKNGWNLIITGRRKERLVEIKEEISLAFSVEVKTVVADLSNNDELDYFLDIIDQSNNIELLINNAGFGSIGNYFNTSYSTQQNMVNVHITATTKITHHVVPHMLKNKRGSIINVASLSAFFPGPKSYFYCSTKSFLVTFSECLHIDLAGSGIQVQALCPSFTKTEFHSRQGVSQSDNLLREFLLWKTPQQVVDKSLRSLGKRNIICIPGFFNRALYLITKILPKPIYYKLAIKNSDTFLTPVDNNTIHQTKRSLEAKLH